MNRKNNNRQTNRIKPVKGQEAEIIIDNKKFFKEDLPFPFVYYSRSTFIAFSETPVSSKYLCACSKSAIESIESIGKNIDLPYLNEIFPKIIIDHLKNNNENEVNLNNLDFREGICHKCNLATPSVRAISPMYGGKFRQYFDWYINQQYLTLGVITNNFLEEKCPDEIKSLILERLETYNRFIEERDLLGKLSSTYRNDISKDEVTYWPNVKLEEANRYLELQKKLSRLTTKYTNLVENIVRQEFGFRKIGEGWISESILYNILKRLYPTEEVIRHYRPVWMEGLELDIFIPKLFLAFEYQGKQHYYPVKAWGGKKALKEVQERDKRKVVICKNNKVQLIKIDYTEPLTEKHIQSVLESTVPKNE